MNTENIRATIIIGNRSGVLIIGGEKDHFHIIVFNLSSSKKNLIYRRDNHELKSIGFLLLYIFTLFPKVLNLFFKTLIIITLIASVIFSFGYVDANWYTGDSRDSPNAYGVKADISTPIANFQAVGQGIANWAGSQATVNGALSWIQSGWYLYPWNNVPVKYVEWCGRCSVTGDYVMNDNYNQTYYYQNWGTTVTYQVYWLSSDIWCGDNSTPHTWCHSLYNSVTTLQVLSEIHTLVNPLLTEFSNVNYKAVDQNWHPFSWLEPSYSLPYYGVLFYSPSHFLTFHGVNYIPAYFCTNVCTGL